MSFLSNPNRFKCVNCTLGDEIVFALVKIRELIDKADDEGEWTLELRRAWGRTMASLRSRAHCYILTLMDRASF
jgi:hypothetical protein